MKSCEICKNYSPLKEPREVTEECSVYGFCFKNFMKNGRTSTYPVYIQGGACRDFVKAPGTKKKQDEENLCGQMSITDFPEVLP